MIAPRSVGNRSDMSARRPTRRRGRTGEHEQPGRRGDAARRAAAMSGTAAPWLTAHDAERHDDSRRRSRTAMIVVRRRVLKRLPQ